MFTELRHQFANDICHRYTKARYVILFTSLYTCVTCVCTCFCFTKLCLLILITHTHTHKLLVMKKKLLWYICGSNMYLIERYPHPRYHCSGSCRCRLYQRLAHRLACLYLFFLGLSPERKRKSLVLMRRHGLGDNDRRSNVYPFLPPLPPSSSLYSYPFV